MKSFVAGSYRAKLNSVITENNSIYWLQKSQFVVSRWLKFSSSGIFVDPVILLPNCPVMQIRYIVINNSIYYADSSV